MPNSLRRIPYPNNPRGSSNRNAALNWIRSNIKSGVLYFADDDNTYDIRLFEEVLQLEVSYSIFLYCFI